MSVAKFLLCDVSTGNDGGIRSGDTCKFAATKDARHRIRVREPIGTYHQHKFTIATIELISSGGGTYNLEAFVSLSHGNLKGLVH